MKERLARLLIRFSRKGFVYFGHGVAPKRQDSYIERLHILEADFVDLLHYWKRMGVDFISMDDLWQLSRVGFKAQRSWVHFTFDDGYRNNLTTLLPIMEAYNIPFSVFVSTGLIEDGERMPSFYIRCAFQYASKAALHRFYSRSTFQLKKGLTRKQAADFVVNHFKYLPFAEGQVLLKTAVEMLSQAQWTELYEKYNNDQLLTGGEMQQLAAHPLVHLGAHGSRHLIHHAQQPAYRLDEELMHPLRYLDEHPVTFAYPNGTLLDYSDKSRQMLVKHGYQLGFTTAAGFVTQGEDPLSIPRFHLTPKGNWVVRKWFYGFE
ncbi:MULTISPECIES: polysaccharide deacetylase family protein [unclassified Carboxylicivirga]|uniref:polysaccharide deacetylase family protein n=1 Tax=Carboxylicivirga TaxID=1628153 RepID=UPI003D3541AD